MVSVKLFLAWQDSQMMDVQRKDKALGLVQNPGIPTKHGV